MREFLPATYEIRRNADILMTGHFSSLQEVLGFIARKLPPGVYLVDRIVRTSIPNAPIKLSWAEITNHGDESVSYQPTPPIS